MSKITLDRPLVDEQEYEEKQKNSFKKISLNRPKSPGFYDEEEEEKSQNTRNEILGIASDFAKKNIGYNETAMTVASGIPATIAGGLGALATEVFTDGDGAKAYENISNSLTYEPRTEAGQSSLNSVASFAEKIPDPVQAAGDAVYETTGSPLLATATQLGTTGLMEIVGLGALSRLRTGAKLLDNGQPTPVLRKLLDDEGLNYDTLSPEGKALIPAVADQSMLGGGSSNPFLKDTANKVLVEQLKDKNSTDGALAGLKLKGNKVVNDKAGLNAIKQGYANGFVQSVKNMNQSTKIASKMMLNKSRLGVNNLRKAIDNRPTSVIGDIIMDQYKDLYKIRRKDGKKLDDIVNNDLKGVNIDTADVANSFNNDLNDLEISYNYDGVNRPQIDFSNSIISKNKKARKAVTDVFDLLYDAQTNGSGAISARQAHKIKRQVDDIMDDKKQEGLSGKGQNFLGSVRKSVNDSIRAKSADDSNTNDRLSSAIESMKDFEKGVGKSIDLNDPRSFDAVGTKARSLLSNIQSRIKLESSIYNMTDTVRKLNPSKKYNEDIKGLVMFADALDARHGTVAKTGMSAQVEQAFNRVLNQGAAQEAINQSANVLTKGYRKVKKINDFYAYESLESILKQ